MVVVTRRTAIVGACACGVLSACGGRPAAEDGGRSPAPGAPSAAAPTGPTQVGVSDIPVGGSIVVMVDAIYPVAVTRPTRRTFAAHTAICPHQHCTVRPGGAGGAGELDCPCHGSRFDAATGRVLAGPAPRPLHAWPFTVHGNTLTLQAHHDSPDPSGTTSSGSGSGEG